MPKDPFIREKFTRERTAARKLATEYFRRFPKDRYQTAVSMVTVDKLRGSQFELTCPNSRNIADEL